MFQQPYGQPAYGQPAYGQPAYGYQQPNFMPPPPQQQGPTIINLSGNNNNNHSGTNCAVCGNETGNLPRKKIGCVAIIWCICLLYTPLCWLIPLCSDGCKDTELVCVKCQTVKNVIPANCC
jgi:hypothetical protein